MRFLRYLLPLGWLVLWACPESRSPEISSTPAPEIIHPRNDIPGLPNFARVSETLYRAGQPTAEGFAYLKKMGVKTVLNLRCMHSDRDELKGLGLKYGHIPFMAFHPEDEDVLAFLKVVTNPAHQPVFVHCQHGSDRTGMMVAIYRLFVQGWSVDEVLDELPRFGFHEIHQNLKDYLRALDVALLKEKLEKAPEPEIEIIP